MKIVRKNLIDRGKEVKIHPITLYQPNDKVWFLMFDTPHKNPDMDFSEWDGGGFGVGGIPLRGFDFQIKPLDAKDWWTNFTVGPDPDDIREVMFMANCGISMTRTKYGAYFTLSVPKISGMGQIEPLQIYPKPRKNLGKRK